MNFLNIFLKKITALVHTAKVIVIPSKRILNLEKLLSKKKLLKSAQVKIAVIHSEQFYYHHT